MLWSNLYLDLLDDKKWFQEAYIFLTLFSLFYMHDYNNNIKLRIRNIIPKNVLIIWIFKMVPSDTNVFVIYVDIF